MPTFSLRNGPKINYLIRGRRNQYFFPGKNALICGFSLQKYSYSRRNWSNTWYKLIIGMKYYLEYTNRAKKDLLKIDRLEAKRLVKKLKSYLKADDPLQFAKPLKGEFHGLYRFRVGKYRIIFNVDKRGKITLLTVLHIAKRSEVYGWFLWSSIYGWQRKRHGRYI